MATFRDLVSTWMQNNRMAQPPVVTPSPSGPPTVMFNNGPSPQAVFLANRLKALAVANAIKNTAPQVAPRGETAQWQGDFNQKWLAQQAALKQAALANQPSQPTVAGAIGAVQPSGLLANQPDPRNPQDVLAALQAEQHAREVAAAAPVNAPQDQVYPTEAYGPPPHPTTTPEDVTHPTLKPIYPNQDTTPQDQVYPAEAYGSPQAAEAQRKLFEAWQANNPAMGFGDFVKTFATGFPGMAAHGAGVAAEAPLQAVGEGLGVIPFANKTLNYLYSKNGESIGNDIRIVSNTGSDHKVDNPYYYLDAGIESFANDPQYQAGINAAYTKGLDLNGDGKIDVKGGFAVFMYANAILHHRFFDNLVSSMGMDPLFAASLVGPVAAAGEAGAASAADARLVAGATGLSKADRVLAAVQAALGGVVKAGEAGNKLVDLPFTYPIKVGGRAMGYLPDAMANGIRWLGQPYDTTAKNIAENVAKDRTAELLGGTAPPGVTAAETSTKPELTVPVGNAVIHDLTNEVPSKGPYAVAVMEQDGTMRVVTTVNTMDEATQAADRINSGTSGNVPGPGTLPTDAATAASKTVDDQIAGIHPTDPTRMATDAEAIAATKQPTDPVYLVQEPDGTSTAFATPEEAQAYASTPPVDPAAISSEFSYEPKPVTEPKPITTVTAGEILTKPADIVPPDVTPSVAPSLDNHWSLRGRQDYTGGFYDTVSTDYPNQLQAAAPELDRIATAFESDVDKKSSVPFSTPTLLDTRFNPSDQAIRRAEHWAEVQDAIAAQGVPVNEITNIPRQATFQTTGQVAAATANDTEKLVRSAIYEPEILGPNGKPIKKSVPSQARAKLYSSGYIQPDPPRPTLADEVTNATLPRGGKITIDNVQYTNASLRAMPIEDRAALGARAAENQARAFERYQRLSVARDRLQPRIQERAAYLKTPAGKKAAATLRDVVESKPPVPKEQAAQELLAGFQSGNVGKETLDYFNTVIGEGPGGKVTAMDGLLAVIDEMQAEALALDYTDKAAVNIWKQGVVNEFGDLMRRMTGKAPEAKVARDVYDRGLDTVINGFKFVTSTARENGIFNIITGPRGWAQDVINNVIKLTWTGDVNAALQTLFGVQWRQVMAGKGDLLDDLSTRLGIEVPHELKLAQRFDTAAEGGGRTGMNRALSKLTRAEPGGWRDRANGILTAPFSSRWIAKGRTASENLARRAMMTDEIEQGLARARQDFHQFGRKLSLEYGIDPQWFSEMYGYQLGSAFSPEDVHAATRSLAEDSGLATDRATEYADKLSQQWRKQVNTLRNDAYAHTRQVLFSYEKTNLDQFIGHFIFYHYWFSRSIPSYIRLGMHNPELAAMWFRSWDYVANQAQKDGLSPGLVGYIRYMGNTVHGFYNALNPLQFFIPFDVLRQDPYANGWYEELAQWGMVNPAMQAMAGAVGWTTQMTDVLNTQAMRNFTVSTLNYLRGQGMIGDVRLQGDWYEQAMHAGYDLANNIAANGLFGIGGLPFAKNVHFFDRNAYNTEVIDYELRNVVAEQTGIPFSETDPRWMPGGQAFEMYATSKKNTAAGDQDPLWEEAFRRWSEANMKNTLLNAAIPGGSRMRLAERDAEIKLSGEGYAAIAAGGQPTPEQQAAMDNRSLAQAAPESLGLTVGLRGLDAVGTEGGRNLYGDWNEIAFGDYAPYEGITINGQYFAGNTIMHMGAPERKVLADKWVDQWDGGTASLAAYRTDRADYITANPELGTYEEYKKGVYGYTDPAGNKTGATGWREMYAKKDPEFKAAMDAQEAKYRGQGKTGAVLQAELDSWATTPQAYAIVNGMQQKLQSDNPADKVPDYGFGGTGTGAGTASSTPEQTMQKSLQATQDKLDAALESMKLSGMNVDMETLVLSNNPLYNSLWAQYNVPSISHDFLLYYLWKQNQGSGTDTSISGYMQYLRDLAQKKAA